MNARQRRVKRRIEQAKRLAVLQARRAERMTKALDYAASQGNAIIARWTIEKKNDYKPDKCFDLSVYSGFAVEAYRAARIAVAYKELGLESGAAEQGIVATGPTVVIPRSLWAALQKAPICGTWHEALWEKERMEAGAPTDPLCVVSLDLWKELSPEVVP